MDRGGGQTWVGTDDDDVGTLSFALSLSLSRRSFPLAQATPALILPFSLPSTPQPLTIHPLIPIRTRPLTCSSRSPSTLDLRRHAHTTLSRPLHADPALLNLLP